jgi:hypothetical protein
MAKKPRDNQKHIVKSICFNADPATMLFLQKQNNISRSIRVLVRQYIAVHNGDVGDVYEEYEAAVQDEVFHRLSAGVVPTTPKKQVAVTVEDDAGEDDKPPAQVAASKPIGFASPSRCSAISYAAGSRRAIAKKQAPPIRDIPEGYL